MARFLPVFCIDKSLKLSVQICERLCKALDAESTFQSSHGISLHKTIMYVENIQLVERKEVEHERKFTKKKKGLQQDHPMH